MLAIFFETLAITAPVFAMLFLGLLLKRVGWINDNFIHTASALVFNVTMPALLFLGIVIVFFIMWVRFSFPRFREDQLQRFAWKVLIPVSLANIMVTAILKVAF